MTDKKSLPPKLGAQELLDRAIDALDMAYGQAYQSPNTVQDWTAISRAASDAGFLALELEDNPPQFKADKPQPRSKPEGDLSDDWREAGRQAHEVVELSMGLGDTTKRTVYVWVSPEEWGNIQAMRAGALEVQTRDNEYEGEDDPSTVDPMTGVYQSDLTGMEARYRTIIAALLLNRGVVSEYVPGATVRRTPPYRLMISENATDGALSLRVDRA